MYQVTGADRLLAALTDLIDLCVLAVVLLMQKLRPVGQPAAQDVRT